MVCTVRGLQAYEHSQVFDIIKMQKYVRFFLIWTVNQKWSIFWGTIISENVGSNNLNLIISTAGQSYCKTGSTTEIRCFSVRTRLPLRRDLFQTVNSWHPRYTDLGTELYLETLTLL